MYTELAINYSRREYDTNEGAGNVVGIILSFKKTQENFTIEFIPATIDESINVYNLTQFLDLNRFEDEAKAQKASAGGIFAWTIKHAHLYMNYSCIWLHISSLYDAILHIHVC